MQDHRRAIGWVVFAILSLPILVFALGVGLSGAFSAAKAGTALAYLSVVGLSSWFLVVALGRRSVNLIVLALAVIALMLVAYAAAIYVLLFGLRIRVF